MLLRTLLLQLYNYATEHSTDSAGLGHQLVRRDEVKNRGVFIALIPVLVLLSGLFAGLTLGYMSLDETQLNVLSMSGTPTQQKYANAIKPIRHNGHLLLVTLLLANMIVNESLPVLADPVLGGGIVAVAVSTVLIVIFAEIIPQSLCSRYGLYIGAKCAPLVRVLIWIFAIVAWPVAKLLEFILGPHHGIIYRRAELKELIALHSSMSPHGGDLKSDTVTIIGHTLDLQEKVAKDAMTPIEKVFMLHIDAKLDYETLAEVSKTGHSRIPIYDEVDFGVVGGRRVKKIIGILLVKQCVLLDPADATPVRQVPLNAVPSVPYDEPLLGILDRFQEGRSHMAIVSPIPKGRAQSIKNTVKQGFTRRFLNNIGLGDDSSSSSSSEDECHPRARETKKKRKKSGSKSPASSPKTEQPENGHGDPPPAVAPQPPAADTLEKGTALTPKQAKAAAEMKAGYSNMWTSLAGPELEQTMPADAVLGKKGAKTFLQGFKPDLDPVGIITLEDVLEELIGEEIFDEFDQTAGLQHQRPPASEYVPPEALREIQLVKEAHRLARNNKGGTVAIATAPKSTSSVTFGPKSTPPSGSAAQKNSGTSTPKPSGLVLPPKVAQSLNFFRTRSAPSTPREPDAALPTDAPAPAPAPAPGPGRLAKVNTDIEVSTTSGLGLIDETVHSSSAPTSPIEGPSNEVTVVVVGPEPDEQAIMAPAAMGRSADPAFHRGRGASDASASARVLSAIGAARRKPSTPAGSTTAVNTTASGVAKGRFKSTPLAAGALGGSAPVLEAGATREEVALAAEREVVLSESPAPVEEKKDLSPIGSAEGGGE